MKYFVVILIAAAALFGCTSASDRGNERKSPQLGTTFEPLIYALIESIVKFLENCIVKEAGAIAKIKVPIKIVVEILESIKDPTVCSTVGKFLELAQIDPEILYDFVPSLILKLPVDTDDIINSLECALPDVKSLPFPTLASFIADYFIKYITKVAVAFLNAL